MSEGLLDYYKIDGLYHLTHVDHIQTIFRYGLLSYNIAVWFDATFPILMYRA